MWSTLTALEEQILDVLACRTAGQGKKTVGEVFSQDRVQQRLVKRMIDVRKGSVEHFELLEVTMVEQFVDVPRIVVELAVSSGDPFWLKPFHAQTIHCCSVRLRGLSLAFVWFCHCVAFLAVLFWRPSGSLLYVSISRV